HFIYVHRLCARFSRHGLADGGSGRASGEIVHVGDDAGGFDFKGALHFLVVFLGEFTGAMFETQIANVFVNGIASLEKLVEFRAMRGEVGGFELDGEDEPQSGERDGDTAERDEDEFSRHCHKFDSVLVDDEKSPPFAKSAQDEAPAKPEDDTSLTLAARYPETAKAKRRRAAALQEQLKTTKARQRRKRFRRPR